MKSAGLCACGVFLLATYTALLRNMEPVNVLYISLPGAVLAGGIGYVIGDILSKPKGNRKKPRRSPDKKGTAPPASSVTGNETFLDDLEPTRNPVSDDAES